MNANEFTEGQRDNGQPNERSPFDAPNNMDLNSMLHDQSTTPAQRHFDGSPATGSAAVRRAEEEAHGVADAEKTHLSVDAFAHGMIEKNFSVWEKLTDRSMYKAVQRVRMDLLNTSAEYRLSFYRTLMDARLEALRERCTSGVAMLKAMFRQQVGSYLMAQMEKMAMEADQRQRAFLNMMKGKYSYAESLKPYPSMHEKYMKSVWEEEGRYLQFLDSLLMRFEAIVGEQFQQHK